MSILYLVVQNNHKVLSKEKEIFYSIWIFLYAFLGLKNSLLVCDNIIFVGVAIATRIAFLNLARRPVKDPTSKINKSPFPYSRSSCPNY